MTQSQNRLDLGKLRPVALSDKPAFDAYMRRYKLRGCETSFVTTFAWDAAYGYKIMELADRIVIYNSAQRLLSFPLGAITFPHELKEMLLQFMEAGLVDEGGFVYSVPENYPDMCPDAAKVFKLKAELSDADYIYDVEKLVAHSGAKLRKKKNHIKHFQLACPNSALEEINSANIAEVREFMEIQARARDLYDEAKAIGRAFDHFDELGLHGIMMRCPCESIASAAVFSALGGDTFDVHFEKTARDVNGSAQMIVWQEAVAIKNLGGAFMNREQDMGEENLRKAKESLDPLEKYQRLRAYI